MALKDLYGQSRNIFMVMYVLDRALMEWFDKNGNLTTHPDFPMTYMPFFMEIGFTGISNNELAALMGISKQGTSRIVRALISSGLVRAEKSKADARLSMLYLTESGKSLFIEANKIVDQLYKEHVDVIGSNAYNATLDVLLKLIAYHKDPSRTTESD